VTTVDLKATQSPMQIAGDKRRHALNRRFATFWRKNEVVTLSGIFFAIVVIAAVFAPWIAPYDPVKVDIPSRLIAPTGEHWFGTDEFGRDLLSRVIYGARPVLLTGILSVLTALVIGTLIGTLAGYRRGWLDELLMRAMDIMLSFPAILLAILIVAALGVGLTNTVIAVSFSMIPTFARLARSIVLTLIHEQYVLASHSVGARERGILLRHILPNMSPPLIVQATAMLAIAISYASALSFLGLGVEPPTPDWGLMVSEGQRLIFDAIWIPFFPGLAITLTVLSVNYLGDGLRDQLDPRLRNR
jgi:ABC-type dipeptide/oligopeptide/nickel transport system permease subunit